jgi:hypothetical protein
VCPVELNVYTFIPRNYVVIGLETSNIIRDNVSRVNFPPKRNVEVGGVVPDSIL